MKRNNTTYKEESVPSPLKSYMGDVRNRFRKYIATRAMLMLTVWEVEVNHFEKWNRIPNILIGNIMASIENRCTWKIEYHGK